MTNILILGANGQIARVATDRFLARTDVRLTLYLRNARRLKFSAPADRVRVVEGAGELEQQARCIVAATRKAGIKRLIFISSMGIYDEVPGEQHGSILDPYRKSARLIEASGLDYTIIRPVWLNNRDEINYATTRKGQPFENASEQVSRKSVADLVLKLIMTPGLEIRSSLGIHKVT